MRRVNVPRMSPAHAWSALRCVGVGRLEGADFQTQQRFPIILNALFVTMFYWWVAARRWQQRLVVHHPHVWCGADVGCCSGGLPVLIPLAALNFTVMFWIDKWLCELSRPRGAGLPRGPRELSRVAGPSHAVLRFYNRPPYQNQALAVMAQNLLPYVRLLPPRCSYRIVSVRALLLTPLLVRVSGPRSIALILHLAISSWM